MEGSESKRKRNPSTDGDELGVQKRLRSETPLDVPLPPELFQHAFALSSNNPKYDEKYTTHLTQSQSSGCGRLGVSWMVRHGLASSKGIYSRPMRKAA